jgi:hypothetical protein
MNPDGLSLYTAWAPDSSPWSAWVKPVIFACAERITPLPAADPIAIPLPPAAPQRAWIIDLDGAASVYAGTALAGLGVCPVPVFNGVPDPLGVIDLRPLLAALRDLARSLPVAGADAPPAFLLDNRRMRPVQSPTPGAFDNRWQLAPQDLPSANRLLAAGIAEVVVVTRAIENDLAHVLRRWQEAGVQLHQWVPSVGRLEPLQVPRPPWFRSMWWRVLVFAGLRANAAGGFGAAVPHPSSG